MKHIVTKRSYKVGACAMAFALLMTTAGGAVVNAEQGLTSTGTISERGNGVLLAERAPNQSFQNGGVNDLESINQNKSQIAPSEGQSSWFGSFWGRVKTFWNALCCSVGLPWCKVNK
ncbi:TPA: SSU0592/SSU0593 family protein [Streptococcus suis]